MKILDIPRSGSYAGLTSSRNRFGQYVRNRRAPVQPIGTGRRAFIRAAFGTASGEWAGLDAELQAAWTSFALSHPITNSLGASVILTGHQMFVAVRTQRLNLGMSSPTTAVPTSTSVHTILSAVVVLNADPVFTVAVDSSATGGQNLLAFSPPISAGRSFPPSFWQALFQNSVTTPVATDVQPLFAAEFGDAPALTKVFVKVTPVNSEGWTGTPLIVSAVCEAT